MRQYLQKHKWHLFVLVILIIIVGISWYVGFVQKNTHQITNYQLPITNKISNDKTPTTTAFAVTPLVTNSDTLPDSVPTYVGTTPGKQVTSYKLQVTTTSTALEAMQNAKLDFKTKTFAGLGEFVEEIGGLKNDPQNGKYWIYFINGESAKLGISTQIVKPNDLIEWNYGTTDF